MANLREEIDTLLEPYQPAIRKILAGFELRRLRRIDEDEVRAAAVMGSKKPKGTTIRPEAPLGRRMHTATSRRSYERRLLTP